MAPAAAKSTTTPKAAEAAPLEPLLPGEQPTLAHWRALSAPFPPEHTERLPRGVRAGDQDKGRCSNGYSADGYDCGGWHVRSIHLTYVGHAGVTDRLNSVDLAWDWAPVAYADGLPMITNGGLWIRLTVLGVQRLGYGDAPGKSGNVTKELIGDAIRNAAMRFGVGTYLWSKSEAAQVLAAGGDPDAGQQPEQQRRQQHPQDRTNAALHDQRQGPAEWQVQALKAFQALPPSLRTWVQENWRWPHAPGESTEAEAVEMLGWMAQQHRDYLERYPDLAPDAAATSEAAPDPH